uniref:zinc finger Y-chromosomal protein-like n=1 Tax=Vespula vulgaris TaxID=7454 RepID=UPI00223B6477|nr:zinc finger Y-chromosomal protein-like [Vespula vulgaris]
MTRHLKFECGQEPRFQCPYCEFRSKQTSNVTSHIRNKHVGQRAYVVDLKYDLLMMDSFMSFVSPTSGNNDVPTTTEQLQHNQLPQKLLYYCPKCLHGFTLKMERSLRLLYGNYGPTNVHGNNHRDNRKADVNVENPVRVTSTRRCRDIKRNNHVCPKCGNGYTVIKSLKRHLRYECGLAPRFKCPYCGTRSKQRAHVNEHIRRKHTGQHTKRIKVEDDLKNLCAVVMEDSKDFDCEEEKPLVASRRRSSSLRDVNRHTCSKCSKSYIHAWHLKRHTKFECGQEPKIQCPYCAARMKQRGHVYRHIRQCHRGQSSYMIVDDQDRRTEEENEDEGRRRINSDRDIYEIFCPKCFKSFQFTQDLRLHMITVCGFQAKRMCPYCERTMNGIEQIHEHIRNVHPSHRIAVLEMMTSPCLEITLEEEDSSRR